MLKTNIGFYEVTVAELTVQTIASSANSGSAVFLTAYPVLCGLLPTSAPASITYPAIHCGIDTQYSILIFQKVF